MGHVRGGVYKVLTKDRILTTKHVRVFEEQFPGVSTWNRNDIQGSLGNTIDDTVSDGSVGGYASDSDVEFNFKIGLHAIHGEDVEEQPQPEDIEDVTYTLSKPSTHRLSQDSGDESSTSSAD